MTTPVDPLLTLVKLTAQFFIMALQLSFVWITVALALDLEEITFDNYAIGGAVGLTVLEIIYFCVHCWTTWRSMKKTRSDLSSTGPQPAVGPSRVRHHRDGGPLAGAPAAHAPFLSQLVEVDSGGISQTIGDTLFCEGQERCNPCLNSRDGGMADAADLKSAALTGVWVRVPLPAPRF